MTPTRTVTVTPSVTPTNTATPSVTPTVTPTSSAEVRYSWTLRWNASTANGACNAADGTWYLDHQTSFANATQVWRMSGSTSYPSARYFADPASSTSRYWNGSSFGSPSLCEGFE